MDFFLWYFDKAHIPNVRTGLAVTARTTSHFHTLHIQTHQPRVIVIASRIIELLREGRLTRQT